MHLEFAICFAYAAATAAVCLLVKYLLMETNLINANKLFSMKANKASEVEGGEVDFI